MDEKHVFVETRLLSWPNRHFIIYDFKCEILKFDLPAYEINMKVPYIF